MRVELLRPWHLTGQDERLAVVVEQTEAARDPIWATTPVDRTPPLSAYGPVSPEVRNLPDGPPVTVIAYETKFDASWWAADIDLPGVASASYRPFVRLAVARYQPESLVDLELSTVVRTDLVQLLPERTLTVDTGGAGLVVTVDGLGPQGPLENRVDVVVETRAANSPIDITALGAVDGVGAWVTSDVVPGRLGQRIEVPRTASGSNGTVRLRVREVELLGPAGQPPGSQTGTPEELTERVVFTDLVPIP
jgi:hypothetical protein